MLLVFRCLRNYLAKNIHFYEFVVKSNSNGSQKYFKSFPNKIKLQDLNSLARNLSNCIFVFRQTKQNSKKSIIQTCSYYHLKLVHGIFDRLDSKNLIDPENNKEYSFNLVSMEKPYFFRSLVSKNLNKNKKSHKHRKKNQKIDIQFSPSNNKKNMGDLVKPIDVGSSSNSDLYFCVENLSQPSISGVGNTPALSYSDVVKNHSCVCLEGDGLKKFYQDVRREVPTPYGQWIKKGWLDPRAKKGVLIKVLSYNILAQNLLEMHMQLYANHDPKYLSWDYRSTALIEEFKEIDADILCLQEVEAQQIEFFDTELLKLGYRGLFKKRTNDKLDGCAIYYRENKFDLNEHVTVEFYQPSVNILNRDNIGIVIRLSPKEDPERSIVVATTHLLFNPNRHDIKLAQMQIMLAEIDRIAYKTVKRAGENDYHPIVLTGDFNLKPYTFVYNLLEYGYVNDIGHSYPRFDLHRRRQLIPSALGINDECQHDEIARNRYFGRSGISDLKYVRLFNSDRRSLPSRIQENVNNNFNFAKFGSGTLSYGLNLTSVYPHGQQCQDATTFQNAWCNVDYIFYGPTTKTRTEIYDGELKLISYLKLPDVTEATYLRTIPNEVCASDHLPLVATFHLPSAIQ